MPRFRKLPVEVDAVQFDGRNDDEIIQFINAGGGQAPYRYKNWMMIDTREGVMAASSGDWIIRGIQGEFYPCKPEIFTKTYEAVTDGQPAP